MPTEHSKSAASGQDFPTILIQYARTGGYVMPNPCGPCDTAAETFDAFIPCFELRPEWLAAAAPDWEARAAFDRAAGVSGFDILRELEAMCARAVNWLRPRTGIEGLRRPPIAWLDANKLVPAGGIVFVYGKPGSHKTGFALAISADLILAGRRVLYIAGEGATGIETARWPALVRHHSADLAAIGERWLLSSAMFNVVQLDTAKLDEIAALAPDMIVLDVLSLFIEGDWNTPHVAGGIMAALRRIAEHTKAAVLVVAHPGKDSERGIIGSSQFKNLADGVLHIEATDGQVICTAEKSKDGETGRVVVRGLHSGIGGVPIVGAIESKRRERSPTSDDALVIHLAAAGATCFSVGLDDHQLAACIAGEQREGEDGAISATRIAKLAEALKKRHKTTRYGETATMAGGRQLFWRWHLGGKTSF